MTDETSQLLSDTAEKLFSDHVTKNCIIDAEKGTWPCTFFSINYTVFCNMIAKKFFSCIR